MLTVSNACLMRGEQLLFQNLSFTAGDSQAIEVLGTNGSGKSSLLKAICGLLPLEHGKVTCKTETIYLGHSNALHPDLTAVENLRFLTKLQCRLPTVSTAVQREFAHAAVTSEPCIKLDSILSKQVGSESLSINMALEHLQLAKHKDIACEHLSAGQKQRVSLARLLLTSCKLWLLDEPFASLDNAGISIVQKMIVNHLNAGGIAVIATHARIALHGCDVKSLWL